MPKHLQDIAGREYGSTSDLRIAPGDNLIAQANLLWSRVARQAAYFAIAEACDSNYQRHFMRPIPGDTESMT
jgi:hypothetical protein